MFSVYSHKVSQKFPISFQSLPYDGQLSLEILKFEVNLRNLQRTLQIACQKFCEMHGKEAEEVKIWWNPQVRIKQDLWL